MNYPAATTGYLRMAASAFEPINGASFERAMHKEILESRMTPAPTPGMIKEMITKLLAENPNGMSMAEICEAITKKNSLTERIRITDNVSYLRQKGRIKYIEKRYFPLPTSL